MATDYCAIHDMMETDREYTAKELGVAPASMTAMVRRGMVIITYSASPKRYKKVWSPITAINMLLDSYLPAGDEFFTTHKKDEKYGMLCTRKNGNILDCYGNVYDVKDVCSIEIHHQFYEV